jgi:membrane-bound metal-dependent hydrolase YbcI (DUF457 family)
VTQHTRHWPADGWLPAALGYIVLADLISNHRKLSLAVAGALDELAHVASTVLLANGLRAPGDAPFVIGAVLGSVALDADHVPSVFGHPVKGTDSERPFTHSWPALAAAGFIAVRMRGQRGRLVRGFACGLASHLFRDFASGQHSGTPFGWPLSRRNLSLPRWCYLGALLAALWTAERRRATLGRGSDTARL